MSLDDELIDFLFNQEDDNSLEDFLKEIEKKEKAQQPRKRRKNPVDDTDFTFHIILSKGIGKLTRKAEKHIYVLVQEAINKILYRFRNQDDVEDAIQTGYYQILTNWQKFNPEKAPSAFVFFTEVQKRAAAEFINKWKKMKGINKEDYGDFQRISINSANSGQGLYNI